MKSVRWIEVNRRDEMVGKQKDFKTEAALQKFIAKLVEKDNFIRIEAYAE
jgi:hypothetical protein